MRIWVLVSLRFGIKKESEKKGNKGGWVFGFSPSWVQE